jgi:aspartate racemase
MKVIGLLGGMSWESTLSYYKIINEGVKTHLGGLHSAKIVMYSVDFAQIEQMQQEGDWRGMTEILSAASLNIQAAGADFLLICTNTMHKIAPEIEKIIQIPLLHIADATAEVIIKNQIKTVGLLGTSFTMEDGFYKDRIIHNYDIDVLVPNKEDRKIIHKTIYQELCLGKINKSSKEEFLRIIDSLALQGAKAVILGCTEIGMLIDNEDTNVMLLDTTNIHADKAVAYAIK